MPELTRIELQWADGEYVFDLPLGQIRELQDKTGVGPMVLRNRLAAGEWRVDDIRETVRLGLIGGGMVPTEALKLVKLYIDDRVPTESLPIAYAIIMAWLVGAPVSKKKPESQTKTTTEPAGSTSTPSMEQAAQ